MIAGIRTPYIDDIVFNVLSLYLGGHSIREIYEILQEEDVKISMNTIRTWIKKAKGNGYLGEDNNRYEITL